MFIFLVMCNRKSVCYISVNISRILYLPSASIVSVLFADIAHTDQVGSTPLILASARNHFEVVQVLLEYGANISVKDKARPWTPRTLVPVYLHSRIHVTNDINCTPYGAWLISDWRNWNMFACFLLVVCLCIGRFWRLDIRFDVHLVHPYRKTAATERSKRPLEN